VIFVVKINREFRRESRREFFVKVAVNLLQSCREFFTCTKHCIFTYKTRHKNSQKIHRKFTENSRRNSRRNSPSIFTNKSRRLLQQIHGAQPTRRPPSPAVLLPAKRSPSPWGVGESATLPVRQRLWGSAALIYPRGPYLRFPTCENSRVYWIYKARPHLRQPKIFRKSSAVDLHGRPHEFHCFLQT